MLIIMIMLIIIKLKNLYFLKHHQRSSAADGACSRTVYGSAVAQQSSSTSSHGTQPRRWRASLAFAGRCSYSSPCANTARLLNKVINEKLINKKTIKTKQPARCCAHRLAAAGGSWTVSRRAGTSTCSATCTPHRSRRTTSSLWQCQCSSMWPAPAASTTSSSNLACQSSSSSQAWIWPFGF